MMLLSDEQKLYSIFINLLLLMRAWYGDGSL